MKSSLRKSQKLNQITVSADNYTLPFPYNNTYKLSILRIGTGGTDSKVRGN